MEELAGVSHPIVKAWKCTQAFARALIPAEFTSMKMLLQKKRLTLPRNRFIIDVIGRFPKI
jgi:hypothetical protein